MASSALTLTDADFAKAPPATLSDADFLGHTESASARPGFWSSLMERANPLTVAKGVASSVMHPIDSLKSWRDQSQKLHDSTVDAFERGDYQEAAAHGINFLANVIPGLGTAMDEAAMAKTPDEFKSKLGAALGTALAAKEVQGAGKLAGQAAEAAPAAAQAVIAQARKPGTLQAAGGAAQVAGGIAALPHEPLAGLYSMGRGVKDISAGLAKRTADDTYTPTNADLDAAQALQPPKPLKGPAFDKLVADAKKRAEAAPLAEEPYVPTTADLDAAQALQPPKPLKGPAFDRLVAQAKARAEEQPPSEPPRAQPIPAQPQPIRLVPRTAQPVPIEPSVSPVLPAGPQPVSPGPVSVPVRPVAVEPKSVPRGTLATEVQQAEQSKPSATLPVETSDPNVVWDPERGHIDIRTGKAPTTEPSVVVLSKDQAQEIVDRMADPKRFYGKTSLKPNSEAQIQRNADALKKATAKRMKLGDLMQ